MRCVAQSARQGKARISTVCGWWLGMYISVSGNTDHVGRRPSSGWAASGPMTVLRLLVGVVAWLGECLHSNIAMGGIIGVLD